jgi:hypothetical protein
MQLSFGGAYQTQCPAEVAADPKHLGAEIGFLSILVTIENLRVSLGIDWSSAVEQLEENILIVAIIGEAD